MSPLATPLFAMVFVKHRKGARSKSCRLCRSRPRANGFTVCKKAGPCRAAYDIERDEKLRTRAAATDGVLTRRQRRVLQRELDVEAIPSTPIDGMVAQYKVPEELFPEKYPVLDHSDMSVRQFVVDIDDDNGRACRDHIVERVKQMDGVKSAIANTGYFVCSLGKTLRGHRWRTAKGIIHRDTTKKTAVSLTCLLFLEDYQSSGVQIWLGSHEFLPGGTLEGEMKKNSIRY